MAYAIVIEPRALADVQKAIDYYDNKRIGLGEKFKDAFDKTLEHICINPFYQIIYKDYRGLIIKEFPLYQVLFFVNEKKKSVYIDAVFQAMQDPAKKPNV